MKFSICRHSVYFVKEFFLCLHLLKSIASLNLNTLDKIDRKVELFEKLMNDLKLIKTSKQIIPIPNQLVFARTP
jgi:hypothetical protein